MFDWINDIMQWIGDLIPEWDLLEPTHGGIKFKPGGKIEVLRPGRLYWYWPATMKVITLPIRRQTLSFNQRLTTKDELTVSFNTVLVYEVDDVEKALVLTHDFEDTIEEVSQKATIKPVTTRNFSDIRKDMADSNEMRNELTSATRSLLRDYGVKTLDAYMSDFTETKVFTHEGGGLAIEDDEDE